MKMKNGLLIYQSYNNIFNIGDYIQSLAAQQFLYPTDIYINREEIDKYSGEEVKLIMNGWFTHNPEAWHPSNSIFPLFVSFHLNSSVYDRFIKQNSLDYFKKYEPIGCRDYDSADLLRKKGINAFFSGCLTLTLGQTYKSKIKDEKKYYFVDPFFEIKKNKFYHITPFLYFIFNQKKIKTLCKKIYTESSLKNIILTSLFYKSYKEKFTDEILFEAEYINHQISDKNFDSEIEKFEYAKGLLYKYSKASLVVTSRIHCALPCLGLETPVIYVEDKNQPEISYCRLNGLRELFNIMDYDKGKLLVNFPLTVKKINPKTLIKNKDLYITLKEDLIRRCKEFAENK